MKFLVLLSLFIGQAFSFVEMKEGVFVHDAKKSFLNEIATNSDLVLDHVSNSGYEVYGPKGLKTYLTDIGANFTDLNAKSQKSLIGKDGFFTYKSLTDKLVELAAKKPEIIKLFSIGKSVQGRDLWVVKISDNVNTDEVEPEFKYISSMHGDEITGRELMMKLIEDLINGYDSDSKIKSLINSTELYIMPSMNPDGSELRQRGNARYADLNRDFPDFSTNDNQNTTSGRQIETAAIMKFQAERHFALSANFHGGSEVVNYPWDTVADPFPLNDLIKSISLEYASKVDGMYNSGEFHGGVTNGYEWYEVDGGMQDWSYNWYGDLQVTVELSNSKWPSYSEIPRYYSINKSSLIRYMERIHQGIGFKFNSAQKGQVVFSKNGESFGPYSFEGTEFYKVLEEGNYKVDVNVGGKHTIYEQSVNVNNRDNHYLLINTKG